MDQLNGENLRQILELLEYSADDLVRGKVIDKQNKRQRGDI